jgi:hypothetical protein
MACDVPAKKRAQLPFRVLQADGPHRLGLGKPYHVAEPAIREDHRFEAIVDVSVHSKLIPSSVERWYEGLAQTFQDSLIS